MKQEQSQLMQKGWLISRSRGLSLVEAILAVSIFGMLVSILIGALLYGQDSTRVVGNKEGASFLAEEALAAVRNIRDDSYSNLSNGTYGLDSSSGEWELSGSSDTEGIYTRTVTITTVDSSRKLVLAKVEWEEEGKGLQNVSLSTYLTNWQEEVPVEDCDSTCTALGYDSGICRASTGECSANGETSVAAGDAYCTVESINTCCCVGGVDATAPATVSDLSISNVASSSIDLTWTAPGDDDGTGTATSYDIRYSTSLIDSSNWASATQLSGEPTPGVASSTETVTVSSLGSEITYYFALKTSDEVPNESGLSNVVATTTLPGPDLTAPAAISDLSLSDEATSSIVLTWTAPGDDGSTGTATSYDIRYSQSLITEAVWSTVTNPTGEPSPQVAGTTESFTVTGLNSERLYYFAIKTTDDEGNVSDISNVPSSTTLIFANDCSTFCRSLSYTYGVCSNNDSTCINLLEGDPTLQTGPFCLTTAYKCCCYPIEDIVAPAAITDLARVSIAGAVVTISFTATGDNGIYGTATGYDVRFSTSTSVITEAVWSTLTQATDEPAPKAAGSAESFTVNIGAYSANTALAIKAYDEVGNYSFRSNTISFTTGELSKVICTEAYRQGYLSEDLIQADYEYANLYANEAILRGYHSWGKPVVRIVQHNLKLAKRVFPFTKEWSQHTAYELGKVDQDSPIGKMLIDTAFPLCEELGNMMFADGQDDYEFDDAKVEAAMEKYYQDYYNMGLSEEEMVPIIKKDFEMFMALAKEVYLQDRANGFVEEREVYDEAWFVKIFKFIKESYREVVDKLSHE